MTLDYPRRPLWAELGGRIHDLPQLDDTGHWHTFNPSVGLSPSGELAVTLRSSNYQLDPDTGELYVPGGGNILSRAWCGRLTPELELTDVRQLTWDSAGPPVKRGTEDTKLYWQDGWRFTGVMVEAHTPVARMVEYQLDLDTGETTWLRGHSGIDRRQPEKNWMRPYADAAFDWVYGPGKVMRHGKVTALRPLTPEIDGLRGNSNLWLLPDGSYLAVVHRLRTAKLGWGVSALSKRSMQQLMKDYRHLLARYDATGNLVELSPEFSFIAPGVEFAAGLVVRGDELLISFGSQDASPHLATVPLAAALSWLRPV
jgi:hypothetical protein